jgi:hypothetical protein
MTWLYAGGSTINYDMTVFQFAMYRWTYQHSPPSQRRQLEELAQRAEDGDKDAARAFRRLIADLLVNAPGLLGK